MFNPVKKIKSGDGSVSSFRTLSQVLMRLGLTTGGTPIGSRPGVLFVATKPDSERLRPLCGK